MNRFPDHARVVFIGDSITMNGLWMARVFDHYLRNFPDADIRMFNTGIDAGTVRSAILYFEENIWAYRPTHAVVMLGMNNVGHGQYAVDKDGVHLNKDLGNCQELLDRYEKDMRELVRILLDRGVKITILTPTCYDEATLPYSLEIVGRDAALEYAGEICRRLAAEVGADFVNMHAPMRLLNTARCVIRDDRVHPVAEGHVLMAQLFLHAQSLVDQPTIAALDSMPAPDDLLPLNRARWEAETPVRKLWAVEWLLLRDQPKDVAARMAFLRTYQPPAPVYDTLRQAYYELAGREEELKSRALECLEACISGKPVH